MLSKAGAPLLARQREVAQIAPPEFRDLAQSMQVHGESIQSFAERELAGDTNGSIDEIVQQLRFPLRHPDRL